MDYDGLNRLTWTDAPGLLTTALYAYDALDNLRWVNYSGYGREPQQHRYDVDANNRHWRYFITNGTASITRTYTHDARGNRLGSTTPGPAFGTRNYTYDRTNRMTSSNDGATWEYYWYDGHGRRTVINRPGGNTVQIYSRDGRLVYERAPGGSTTKHIYLAGRLVGSMTGSTTTYLHTDTLGTVVRRTNAAGLELGPRQTWEPYGSLSNGQYLQAPGFTGHVSDVHSGLIYMQQRHYDPVAMRFMSVDPVHVDTGSGGNFNRYWYANNNPYLYVDPDGQFVHVFAGALIGALASGITYIATSDNPTIGGLASSAGTGAVVGAATAAVPGAIAAGSLNFGSRAANIGASVGNAVAAGAAGDAVNQALVVDAPVDMGQAMIGGVANAAGLGAGRAIQAPAAAIATRSVAGNPGLPVTSLTGQTFQVGAVAPSTVTDEYLQHSIQNAVGEALSSEIRSR